MDNDAARHELTEALALVQEHMADLAVVEKRLAALSSTATAADGTVAVTVDARGVVSATVIDESYLDDYELADLADFITGAAQEAAGDVARRSAELLAPMAQRRARFPSLSDIVEGAPDIRDLVSQLNSADHPQQPTDDRGHEATSDYPIVRS